MEMAEEAEREQEAEQGFRKHDEMELIALVIVSKALLFLLGGQAHQILTDKKLGVTEWLSIWNKWDSVHYQKLAQFGYSGVGELRPSLVFYPLYPWLIRILEYVISDYLISAFVISTVASVIVAVVFYRLVSIDHSREIARYSVWFLFIFPTSYFLHIGYTESLFLTLALGAIYAGRTNRWVLAGVIGALACLTRANGLILVPALAVEIAHQFWTTRKWRFDWLSIGLIPLGFCGYLAINAYAAGDAFAFLPIRKEVFFISSAPPWVGIQAVIGQLNMSPANAEMVGVQELFFICLGFVCAAVSWFKLRPMYSVWITCSWLLFVSVTFVASVPRYTLTLFPVFILFALLARQKIWLVAITVWSLIYLGLFSSLFASGRWAF
jgi:Gpi18-like mannosyltransferase